MKLRNLTGYDTERIREIINYLFGMLNENLTSENRSKLNWENLFIEIKFRRKNATRNSIGLFSINLIKKQTLSEHEFAWYANAFLCHRAGLKRIWRKPLYLDKFQRMTELPAQREYVPEQPIESDFVIQTLSANDFAERMRNKLHE
jgi:hypothetical protein